MAIINSLIAGKARNKIGNHVYMTLHGKTIVREYLSDVSRPNSPAQLANNAQFGNAVRLWSDALLFLADLQPNTTQIATLYEWYLSRFKPLMPTTLLATAGEIIHNLPSTVIENMHYIYPNYEINPATPHRWEFSIQVEDYETEYHFRVLVKQYNTLNYYIFDKVITAKEMEFKGCNFNQLPVNDTLKMGIIYSLSKGYASSIVIL